MKQYQEMSGHVFSAGQEGRPKSTLVSRNITVQKRRTSVRLEPEMWVALKEISERENCSIHDVCTLISLRKNQKTSLTAAIRVFLMLYFRAATTEEGHRRAGHGNFEFMKQRAKVSAPLNPLKKKDAANYSKAYSYGAKAEMQEGVAG